MRELVSQSVYTMAIKNSVSSKYLIFNNLFTTIFTSTLITLILNLMKVFV